MYIYICYISIYINHICIYIYVTYQYRHGFLESPNSVRAVPLNHCLFISLLCLFKKKMKKEQKSISSLEKVFKSSGFVTFLFFYIHSSLIVLLSLDCF